MGAFAARSVLSGVYLDAQYTRRGWRVGLSLALFVALVLLVIAFIVWGMRQP